MEVRGNVSGSDYGSMMYVDQMDFLSVDIDSRLEELIKVMGVRGIGY